MLNAKVKNGVKPLIQDDRQDTLMNASAVIHCLQSMDLKIGLEDEGELGMNLILETVREALRYEAVRRGATKAMTVLDRERQVVLDTIFVVRN